MSTDDTAPRISVTAETLALVHRKTLGELFGVIQETLRHDQLERLLARFRTIVADAEPGVGFDAGTAFMAVIREETTDVQFAALAERLEARLFVLARDAEAKALTR